MRGDNPAPDVLPAAPDQSGRQGAPRRLFRTPSGGEPLRSAMTAEARLASRMLAQDGQPPAGRVTQRRRQVTTAITPAAQIQGSPAAPPPVTPARSTPARAAGSTASSSALDLPSTVSVASASDVPAPSTANRSRGAGCTHANCVDQPAAVRQSHRRSAGGIGLHMGCCNGHPNGPGMVSGGPRNTAWHETTCSRRPAERIAAFSVLNPMIWWFQTIVAVGEHSDLRFDSLISSIYGLLTTWLLLSVVKHLRFDCARVDSHPYEPLPEPIAPATIHSRNDSLPKPIHSRN